MGKLWSRAKRLGTCSLLTSVRITIVSCLLREPGATVRSPLFSSVVSRCQGQRGCTYGGDERTCSCCGYRHLTSSFPEHAAFCHLTTLFFVCLQLKNWSNETHDLWEKREWGIKSCISKGSFISHTWIKHSWHQALPCFCVLGFICPPLAYRLGWFGRGKHPCPFQPY